MKLQFYISYHTQWGESVHILLHVITSDHHVKTLNLSMDTNDGYYWSADVQLFEQRQHPAICIWYTYQVERMDGTVLRRECNPVPRMMNVSKYKLFVFHDTWEDEALGWEPVFSGHDISLHLKSVSVSPLPIPTSHKTVILHVKAFGLLPNERIAVLGNVPTIGKWNISRYVPMTQQGGNVWMLSINADMIKEFPVLYKYVILNAETGQMKYWEAGDNRTTGEIEETEEDQVIVLNDTPVRIKRLKIYEANLKSNSLSETYKEKNPER